MEQVESSRRSLYLRKRVLMLSVLGFSSGLPLALTGSTLQAWLFSEGVSVETIGLLSLVGLPYSLKVFWAPLVDWYRIPLLGRRRGWIIAMQGGLVCMIAVLAALAWVAGGGGILHRWHGLMAVSVVTGAIAFLSATQDIAVDAYRADILKPEERGAGAATTVFGYRLAMMVSGAVALILSDHLSWATVFSMVGLTMLWCVGLTCVVHEPPPPSRIPMSLREAVSQPLKAYFERDHAYSMLLFIVSFKIGDVLAAAMTTPMLLDIGFSRSDVGMVNKGLGLVSTLFGAFVGGAMMARLGLNRALWVFALLQALSNVSFAVLAWAGNHYGLLIAAVGLENLTGGMGTAGFVAFLMSLCDREYSATQYALLSSLTAVTRVLASVPTGLIAAHLGWVLYYVVTVLGAVPGILLLSVFAPWRGTHEGR